MPAPNKKIHSTVRIHVFGPGHKASIMREFDANGLVDSTLEYKGKLLDDMLATILTEFNNEF